MTQSYQEIQAARFGRDGVLPGIGQEVQPTASGDWPTIEGRPNLLAAHIRRAITAPRQMTHRPLYGGGLILSIEAPADPATLAEQDVGVRQNALRDLRIQEATVETVPDDATGRVITRLEIQPRGEDTTETATLVQE